MHHLKVAEYCTRYGSTTLLHRIPRRLFSFHGRLSSAQPKMKESTAQSSVKLKSALFINGASSQFIPFVVEPHLDVDGVFHQAPAFPFQDELDARGLKFNLGDMLKSWTDLKALWAQRDRIEARRKERTTDNPSEEVKQEGRRLREELREVEGKISAMDSETIVNLLKLPTPLHRNAPRDGFSKIIFKSNHNHYEECDSSINTRLWQKYVAFTDDAPNGYYLRGDLAELELRLMSFSTNYLKKLGFSSISGPHLYKPAVIEGCGADLLLEKLEAYMIKTLDSHNSPFKSMFLTNNPLHNFAAFLTNCETDPGKLPLYLQNSGRVYQPFPTSTNLSRDRLLYPNQTHCTSFCVAYADPEETDRHLDMILNHLRVFYSSLDIPFQIINIPAADLASPAQALRYEVQVRAPKRSLSGYVTCGYIAVNNDFVSKRLRCHVGKVEEMKFLSIIHGSLLNLTPFLACALENIQNVNVKEWFQEILPSL